MHNVPLLFRYAGSKINIVSAMRADKLEKNGSDLEHHSFCLCVKLKYAQEFPRSDVNETKKRTRKTFLHRLFSSS